MNRKTLLVLAACIAVGLSLMDFIRLSWNGIVPSTSIAGGWKGALLLGLISGVGLGPCTFAYLAPVLGGVYYVSTAF